MREHGSDYERRLAVERDTFAGQVDVHGGLPDSAHHWSRRHLLPKLHELGVADLDSLVTDTLRARAAEARTAGRDAVVLSLGSGNGDQELRWLGKLVASGVDNVRLRLLEVNPEMRRRAAEAAHERGLGERVEHLDADLNTWKAETDHDVIVAYQVLHHVLDLEHLCAQLWHGLRPDGVLVVHDMIGRNGHRRWPEALEVIERVWATLPPELRRNAVTGAVDEHFVDLDCAADGFEGIRAQDVLPVLLEFLHPSLFLALGNVVDPFIDRVYGHNFDPADDAHRAFLDDLGTLDDTLIDLGVVTPTRMTALFHPRPHELRAYRGRTPERSVRRTGIVDTGGRVSFHPDAADPHRLVGGAGLAVGRLHGVEHDRWVGRTATLPVRTTAAVEGVDVELYVPEWMPDPGTLTLTVDGDPAGTIAVGHGRTEAGAAVTLPAHRSVELTLSADWWAVPADIGAGDDRRNLSYVLAGLTLRDAGT